jgi:DNA-binding MarR family transcriptional regulator
MAEEQNKEFLMEQTISKQIEQYAKDNPFASETEIRNKFEVSRQLVSQIFHQIFTAEELATRRYNRLNIHSEKIKAALQADKSYAEIAEELGINKNKLTRIINSNVDLMTIIREKDTEDQTRIDNISKDWSARNEDDSFAISLDTIMEKYNIGTTPSSAASYISKLRSRYGSEMFPIRIENQFNLEEKVQKYNAFIAEGKTNEEIYPLLGYKTLASMRASMAYINRKEKT